MLAWRTLKDLERQTTAVHVSAEAARKSAEIAEQALRISQRADILLLRVVLRRVGAIFDVRNWTLELTFKNFGVTRANNVQLSLTVLIEGVTIPSTTLPPITMGGGGEQHLAFLKFDKYVSQQIGTNILRAEIPLRFEARAVYEDVFGTQHTAISSGTLIPDSGDFQIDKHECD